MSYYLPDIGSFDSRSEALEELDKRIAQNGVWAGRLLQMHRAGDLSAGPRLNRCNEAWADLIEMKEFVLGRPVFRFKFTS